MKGHLEIIACPECELQQLAFVEHLIPFNGYGHECESCKHVILESEWNTRFKFKTKYDLIPFYVDKISKAYPQTSNGYEQDYFEYINKIILKKYSPETLLYIKERAWSFINYLVFQKKLFYGGM